MASVKVGSVNLAAETTKAVKTDKSVTPRINSVKNALQTTIVAIRSVIQTPTDEQLFTITGNHEEVFVVGGSNSGVFLRGDKLRGLSDDTPAGAALLQGVTVDPNGVIYVAGAGGDAYRQVEQDEGWQVVDLAMGNPQSVHAIWSDCEGDIWGAGGSVLSPTLDAGLLGGPAGVSQWQPDIESDVEETCPAVAIDRVPDGSIARRWIEQSFDSIRRDFPHPPMHARNLHHLTITSTKFN